MENVPGPFQWFAVQVKSRHEKVVAGILEYKGLEPFLPLYRARNKWSDRTREVHLPLFPGYVFCNFNPAHRTPVLSTPGVFGIIRFGRELAPVATEEITALQRLMSSGLVAEPWPKVEVGQEVEIDAGPLTGCHGRVVNVKNSDRLLLSVTLLQRAVLVELDRDWVKHSTTQRLTITSTPASAFTQRKLA